MKAYKVNHDITDAQIEGHIADCTARPLKPFRTQAKRLIASRGSCFAALQR